MLANSLSGHFEKNNIQVKLFEIPLNNLAFLGIKWDQGSKKYSCTRKIFIALLLCVLCMILTVLFLIYDAKTFSNYTSAMTVLLAYIMCFIIYVILYLNENMLNKFMENWQQVLETSKLNGILI